MKLTTLTCHPHTAAMADSLASMGYDSVIAIESLESLSTPEWRDGIQQVRDRGMKVLLSWPHYGEFSTRTGFSVDDPSNSFRASDGRTNTSEWLGQPIDRRNMQFSHWNDRAEEALVAELPLWLENGPEVDGIHVNVSHCDRMFPTDWYAFGDRAIEGTRMYWSFDDTARAKWSEASGGAAMPTHPDPGVGDDAFYRWYQGGYIDRLSRLTDAALDLGAREISTWFLPHTRWTAENMTGGVAGSIEPLDAWRQHVIDRGVSPLMIVAHVFGLGGDWAHLREDSEESIRRACAPPFNWPVIVGAECDVDGATTPQRVSHHGRLTAAMGASGLLCSDYLWLGLPPEAAVAAAIEEVRPLFEK